MVWGCVPSITLFLVPIFHESGPDWFRSFSEHGRKYVSTKRHNNICTELEFEIAVWSLLGSAQGQGGGTGKE